jgi:hypothetical protein
LSKTFKGIHRSVGSGHGSKGYKFSSGYRHILCFTSILLGRIAEYTKILFP